MDKKLVEMLKEKIIFPQKLEERTSSSKLSITNYRTSSRKDSNTLSSRLPRNIGNNDDISKPKSDNNATIAIKILYDSCMKEGKISKREIVLFPVHIN